MFDGCILFNQPVSFNTSAAFSLYKMFNGCSAFNSSINLTDTSLVTDFSSMFNGCILFNQSVSFNTSAAEEITSMFNGCSAFNQDISDWQVTSLRYGTNFLNGTSFTTDNYNLLLIAWAAQSPLRTGTSLGVGSVQYYGNNAINAHNVLTNNPNNWSISDGGVVPYPCFKEDSKILTDKGYIPIQYLKKGDLVKTLKHDFKPIDMIGKREIYHPASNERIKYQLYVYSQDKVDKVMEPLIITGCHSILVDEFISEEQRQKTIEVNGDTYVTDRKYRLPACADERASVYEVPGTYTIYHFALENNDYYMNYGVYANGLLVETCSKRYLKELSGMTIM
jgi:hypothetical protein